MIAAFAVRLGWGLAAGVMPGSQGFDDAGWYHSTAIGLARGIGYASPFDLQPTAAWPPGYPALLAGAYRLFGASPSTAVALNAVSGAVTCLLVWHIGRALAGRRAGLVAASLFAAFPSTIFFAALVLSETFFTCVACALVLAGVRLVGRDAGGVPWLLWGVGAGLVALVRAEAIVLLLVPAVTLASRGALGASGRILAVTVFGAIVALAPWTVRNARVFGTLVPTSTGFGRTLWIGHNPDADGGMRVELQRAMAASMTAAGVTPAGPAGELATNRLLLREAIAFAVAHPGREVGLTAARVYHLFRGDHVWQSWYGPGTPRPLPSASARTWLGRFGDAYYLAVGFLALAGWLAREPEPAAGWRFVDLAMGIWIAVFALVYGDPRFHQVLLPFACVLASSGLVGAADHRQGRELGATRAA